MLVSWDFLNLSDRVPRICGSSCSAWLVEIVTSIGVVVLPLLFRDFSVLVSSLLYRLIAWLVFAIIFSCGGIYYILYLYSLDLGFGYYKNCVSIIASFSNSNLLLFLSSIYLWFDLIKLSLFGFDSLFGFVYGDIFMFCSL